MKIYYAHAICLYGTDDEEMEMEHIANIFPDHDILNPRLHPDPEENGTMDHYKMLVSSCNMLVFTRLLGKITAGVGLEINHALAEKKMVYELNNGKVKQIKKPVKYISREDTISLYGKYRVKKGGLNLSYLLKRFKN